MLRRFPSSYELMTLNECHSDMVFMKLADMSLQAPRTGEGLHTQGALVVAGACVCGHVAPIVTGRHNALTTDFAAIRVVATVHRFMQP